MRRLSTSASLVGLVVLCAGCVTPYSRRDMERDSSQFVPAGAYVEGTESSFDTVPGYPPDDTVGGWIRILMPGTPTRRLAAIRGVATRHGWRCHERVCVKPHVSAQISIGVALPQADEHIYDEISITPDVGDDSTPWFD